MLFSLIYTTLCLCLDLFAVRSRGDRSAQLELMALRHEVRVLRRQTKRVMWSPIARLVLAALSRRLPRSSWLVFPVRPETLMRWHRELIRRKWALFARRRGPGRPPLSEECRRLVLRLATENPPWGYQRMRGELAKLGYHASATPIRSILRRQRRGPAPRRGMIWLEFVAAQAGGLLACDFFTIETVRLKLVYVLFFIELRSRRVFVAGCIEHPTEGWVVQQARNLTWQMEEDRPFRLLIHDRDTKFSAAFDPVFAAQGVRAIRTPYRSPRANAHAERWVGTVRRECLNWILIRGADHLERVLAEYVTHYNAERPHRSLQLHPPVERAAPQMPARMVGCRDRLGGLIREYCGVAA